MIYLLTYQRWQQGKTARRELGLGGHMGQLRCWSRRVCHWPVSPVRFRPAPPALTGFCSFIKTPAEWEGRLGYPSRAQFGPVAQLAEHPAHNRVLFGSTPNGATTFTKGGDSSVSKVTELPYKSPYCSVCGKPLPRGRTRKCYACRPPRKYKPIKKPEPNLPYSLEDRAAQAVAYGLSYGRLMAIIESGGDLPPLKKSIVWPAGSDHAGE